MIRKLCLLVVLVAAFVATPSAVWADDTDGLKAVLTQVIDGINSKNVDALEATWHDKISVFGALAPFPAAGKAANRLVWGTFFTNVDRVKVRLIDATYTVIGNTGVAQGFFSNTRTLKDGATTTVFGRLTSTYVKAGGKWLALAVHVSKIPTGEW